MCSTVGRPKAPPSHTAPARDPRPATDFVHPLTSFVGRTSQLSAVTALIGEPGIRLLTLAGPAGVGKTRLAEAVADAVAGSFADGVRFVSLAAVRQRERVPFFIAEALGLQSVTGESFESRVINYARDREMLLVLDNLEHLLPVPFLTRLLTSCRHLTVLATSREVLHLSGEFEYVVPPMEVPNLDAPVASVPLEAVESVALLVDRARQVRPGFALTHDNAGDIAAICARLDGLPLAIELAAARLKVFSPAALLDRLSDRLALLTGGPTDRPAHQRTIRDTIGWSHDLLSHREQRVFRHLGVFMGRITAEAVTAVCTGDDGEPCSDLQALDELISLVDKSLVQRARQEGDGPRFYLLETIRHYALERLEAANEVVETKLRHAGYYLHVAEAALPLLIGPDQAMSTARLEAEQVNMRSALMALREADAVEDYSGHSCLFTTIPSCCDLIRKRTEDSGTSTRAHAKLFPDIPELL